MIRSIAGATGEVRWGYRLAAIIRDWTAIKNEGDAGVTLTGTIDSQNAIWISQRPLVFMASHTKGVWRWPISSLQISGGHITAALSPMEQEQHVLSSQKA